MPALHCQYTETGPGLAKMDMTAYLSRRVVLVVLHDTPLLRHGRDFLQGFLTSGSPAQNQEKENKSIKLKLQRIRTSFQW